MWEQIALILGSVCAFAVALFLAHKNGSKAAQLESLKAELKKQAKEQERAKQVTDTVYSLSIDDARKRLHEVANRNKQ